jgi:hypothetical protein
MAFSIRKFWIFIALLSLAACIDRGAETYQGPYYSLQLIDTIRLQHTGDTPLASTAYQLIQTDSGEYMVKLNSYLNSLDYYQLPGGELSRIQRFLKGGRNGVGELLDFLIYNADSVYLLSSMRLSLSDIYSEELKRIVHVEWPAFGDMPPAPYRPIFRDAKGVTVPFMGIPGILDHQNTTGKGTDALMVRLPLEGGFENLGFWPKRILEGEWSKNWLNFGVSDSHRTGHYLFSFPSEADLVFTDLHRSSTMVKTAGGWQVTPDPSVEDEATFLQIPSYGPVFYDPTRRLYIRVLYGSSNGASIKELYQNRSLRSQLILLNTDFQQIGLVDLRSFPPLDLSIMLFSQDGIYIRAIDEDSDAFCLFELYELD